MLRGVSIYLKYEYIRGVDELRCWMVYFGFDYNYFIVFFRL